MVRRYLIVNGVSTAVMYGAALAFAPSVTGAMSGFVRGFDLYALDHSWLLAVRHGILAITSGI